MSRKKTLLACICCYAAACLVAMLPVFPHEDSVVRGISDLALAFPFLPAASFAILFTCAGLENVYVAGGALGYVVHIVLVAAAVVARERWRYTLVCIFLALLVIDVCALVTGSGLLPWGAE